jgi:tRNA (cytidine32/uridine32-2'-O)-methyltransferase
MFANIRIVLVGTTHPGNIGATARAMKNMGLEKLYLVQPKIFPHPEATARAAGADDILNKAIIVTNLNEALAGCKLIFGTSARERSLPVTVVNPRQAAIQALSILSDSKFSENIAFVFGQERMGLTNDELLSCNYHIFIPAVENFSSLNLAASVQIITYELYMAHVETLPPTSQNHYESLASAENLELFYQYLQQVLITIEFLQPNNPRYLMRRLRRLFNRAKLEEREVNILRGILAMVQKKIEE